MVAVGSLQSAPGPACSDPLSHHIVRLAHYALSRLVDNSSESIYFYSRQAILTQEPSFSGKAWQDVSQAAQAFVKRLLNK